MNGKKAPSVRSKETKKAKKKTSQIKGMKFLQKLKEKTSKAKNKLATSLKNKKKKRDSESSSSSSSDETTRKSVVEIRQDNPFLAPNQQKKAIPGAVHNFAQPEGIIQKLMMDERPDMDTKGLSEAEAKILDSYLKQHTELIGGDHLYTEDNNEEDNRTFTRYEIIQKYNEGRYAGVYLASRKSCVNGEMKAGEHLCILKMALRKNSARSPYFIWNEGNILKEVGNKRLEAGKAPYTAIQVDSGKICDMPYIVMNLLDRNLAKIKEDCDGRFGQTTAFYVAIETLNSIADFHGKNYVHRDIKPTNFCSGIEEVSHKLFLIDFGDAVKKGDKQPRLGVADGLTLPYWSVEVHQTGSCSDRGDIESWFYLIMELWVKTTKISDVEAAKRKFWSEYKQVLSNKHLLAIGDFLVEKKELSFPKDYQTIKQKVQEGLDEASKGGKVTPEWVKAVPSSKKKAKK